MRNRKKVDRPITKQTLVRVCKSGLLCMLVLSYSFGAVADTPIATKSSTELAAELKKIEDELALRGLTKNQRIKRTESYLYKLNNRHSWKKAAIGAVVTAAATATPVGAVLGGIFGGFIGRSENYEKIEEKISGMEQDIIVSEDDFLTSEEVRLEKFTRLGKPESISQNQDDRIDDSLEVRTEMRAAQEGSNETGDSVASMTMSRGYDSDHQSELSNSSQDTEPLNSCYRSSLKRSRKAAAQCFYMTEQ